MRTIIALAIATLIAGSEALQAACSDGQFNNSTWSAVKIQDTSPGATATFTAANGTVGTPAPGRTTQQNFGAGNSQIRVAHLESGCGYNPATQGAIATISYKFDSRLASGSGAVAYRALIFQNGTYYVGPLHAVTVATSWQGFSGTLSPAMFTAIEGKGPEKPDFTCTGSDIRFGYETSNSAGGATQTVSHIDNWAMAWEPDQPCAAQPTGCPAGAAATTIDGITYCCVTDDGKPVNPETAQVCCTRTCPAGSVETTVDGIKFCCEIGAGNGPGKFCCKPK